MSLKTQSRKRLLLVNLSQDWGGGEKWFFGVGRGLLARGYELKLMVRPGSELEKRVAAQGLPYMPVKARFLSLLNPFKVLSILKKIRKYSPDAVILNGSHELKFVGLAAAWAGVPHIIFRRGLSFALKINSLNRWYFRHIVTAFLSGAQSTYQAFLKAFPVIKQYPNKVIANGIDLEKWPVPEVVKEPFLIGLSSRLSPEKGVDRAITVIAELVKRGLPVKMRVLGEGPQRPELEQMIRQNKLEDHIELTGFSKNVYADLAPCQLFLFTSLGEGTSNSVIEAMAMGLPCVVYAAPSMDELVVDGETGFIVESNHVSLMADRVEQLLTSESIRKKMSQQARFRAETTFSFERVLIDLSDWVESL